VSGRAPIRAVAIVGLGTAGGLALAGLEAIPGARCVAGVDPRRLQAASAPTGVEVASEVAALRAPEPLDLVVVSSPTAAHVAGIEAVAALDPPPPRVWVEKPLATDADELARARRARADARVLLHTAFSPEVLWAAARVAGWQARHGAVAEVACEFHDPYASELERAVASLHSSWLDSGVNALSVAERFVRVGAARTASGRAPLRTSASFDARAGDALARVEVATSWAEPSRAKRTRVRFADGAALVLDHERGTATLSAASGDRLDGHGGRRAPLAARYAAMFAAYAAGDPLVYPPAVEDRLHRALVDARALLG
jgi:predicted dehydrogenase